ncbi:MAG TPA: SH3 domain-containing protein [Kofleriaceae bacterium]
MRVSALILLVVLGTVGVASAEKVKTNQSTKLFAGPGEQKKVLLKVKSGQNMTLLAQEGRWLKVRVQGRTGYVPRSKVDMADDGEIARNTRRRPFVDGRSRRRGFGGEAGPDDRVGADALGEGQDEGGGGDDEEEADEPKKPKKTAKASKVSEDDEEETKKPEKKPAKAAKAKPADDEEEDEPKKSAKASEDEDEDEPKKGGDEADSDEEVVDDEADKRATARVAKRVSVYSEADTKSDEEFVARPTDVLYPVDSKGKWTQVENAEGDLGWVETEYLDTGDGGGGTRKRTIDVSARMGLMFIQQGMRTQGSTNLKVPDNYNINTSSVTLSLGGGIAMPFKKKYILGGEATYDYANTLFGGVFYDPDGKDGPMPGVNTKLTLHNINVRGMAGIDLKKKSGMAFFGRLGYRYQSYLVAGYSDPAKNPGKIPQEIVKAPTLGAAMIMPKLTNKIGLRVSLDAILFAASISQTKGLEDGSAPTLKAVVFGTGVTYKWKKSMDLQATYDLRYMGIDFGPPLATSTRGHMGTNITRTDFFHMVTFGVAKPF